jgi:hypothetical protein
VCGGFLLPGAEHLNFPVQQAQQGLKKGNDHGADEHAQWPQCLDSTKDTDQCSERMHRGTIMQDPGFYDVVNRRDHAGAVNHKHDTCRRAVVNENQPQAGWQPDNRRAHMNLGGWHCFFSSTTIRTLRMTSDGNSKL